jgi:glycosyltransferase involved in cell wall biosynthesis
MPFFSIIIPTYNSEGKLADTIESILSQTFGDFEILLIDGLSTDNTITITRRFIADDKRIKLVSEKDCGIYDAMNKGVRRAKGRWIYFLGSSDYLLDETVLEKVVPFLDKKRYDFVYGDVIAPDYGGVYGGEFNRDRLILENICHQSIFYHKSLFDKLGLYSLKYPLLADWVFNLKCFYNKSIRVKYILVTIAYYAPAGLSKIKVDERFLADKDTILSRLEYSSASFMKKIRLVKQYIVKYSKRNLEKLS